MQAETVAGQGLTWTEALPSTPARCSKVAVVTTSAATPALASSAAPTRRRKLVVTLGQPAAKIPLPNQARVPAHTEQAPAALAADSFQLDPAQNTNSIVLQPQPSTAQPLTLQSLPVLAVPSIEEGGVLAPAKYTAGDCTPAHAAHSLSTSFYAA